MPEPEISPLAQKIAESRDVDLTALYDQNPDGKITARNVLEFLSLTVEEEALIKRQTSRGAKAPATPPLTKAKEDKIISAAGAYHASEGEGAKMTPKFEEPEPIPPSPAVKESQKALGQARTQLQATAMVHQKALMQVGSLKQKNEALDMEVDRLKSKEEAARSFIQELEAKQRNLERELEESKKKPKPLAWLRKKLF